MPDILCFSRNRCTTVEQVDAQTLRSSCRVQDTLMDAQVEVLVKVPDLELIDVKGEIRRSDIGGQVGVVDGVEKVIGSRVGPGIKKIIHGFIEHSPHAEQIATLLDECCNGVILSFTRDVLVHVPKDRAGEKESFMAIVRANPRLYNSCAALSADSPLMAGVDLERS